MVMRMRKLRSPIETRAQPGKGNGRRSTRSLKKSSPNCALLLNLAPCVARINRTQHPPTGSRINVY
jgi:hypothetical protein